MRITSPVAHDARDSALLATLNIVEPVAHLPLDASLKRERIPAACEHCSQLGFLETILTPFQSIHGGRIWVKGEAGKGTTFYVSLPIQALPRRNDPKKLEMQMVMIQFRGCKDHVPKVSIATTDHNSAGHLTTMPEGALPQPAVVELRVTPEGGAL